MARTYEYYIWADPEDDDNLYERINEALRNANLQCELIRFEED